MVPTRVSTFEGVMAHGLVPLSELQYVSIPPPPAPLTKLLIGVDKIHLNLQHVSESGSKFTSVLEVPSSRITADTKPKQPHGHRSNRR
jgi:hypothetical protein